MILSKVYNINHAITKDLVTQLRPFLRDPLHQLLLESAGIDFGNHEEITSYGKIQFHFYKRSYIKFIELFPAKVELPFLGDAGNFQYKVINQIRQSDFGNPNERMNYYKNLGYLKTRFNLHELSFDLKEIRFYGYDVAGDFAHLQSQGFYIDDHDYKTYKLKTLEEIWLVATNKQVITITCSIPKSNANMRFRELEKEKERVAKHKHWIHGPLNLRYHIQ